LTQVDQVLVKQMISMVFSLELAHEAVLRSPPDSLEKAVDYCFNHPNTGSTSTAAAVIRLNQIKNSSFSYCSETVLKLYCLIPI
jgi:uncharacterized UBP type Zn finger protein